LLIGCCLNLLAEGPDCIGIDCVDLIAGLGYDYVELPIVPMMALSERDFDALCGRVRRAGIPCRSCCNLFPADLRLIGPEVNYDSVCRYLEQAVTRTRRLGASVIVFGSPAARYVPDGFPRELAMLQFIKAVQLMDEYADDGLRFAIEHVCRLEGNIIYTVKEGCMVHEVCRTKRVGVLADTYHMGIEGEPVENIALAGSSLLHVHTANPAGRIYPAPNDGVNYRRIMDTLKSINYQGGVSVEAYSKDPAADARTALDILRRAMA